MLTTADVSRSSDTWPVGRSGSGVHTDPLQIAYRDLQPAESPRIGGAVVEAGAPKGTLNHDTCTLRLVGPFVKYRDERREMRAFARAQMARLLFGVETGVRATRRTANA